MYLDRRDVDVAALSFKLGSHTSPLSRRQRNFHDPLFFVLLERYSLQSVNKSLTIDLYRSLSLTSEAHERTSARAHERTSARAHERTSARAHERTSAIAIDRARGGGGGGGRQ